MFICTRNLNVPELQWNPSLMFFKTESTTMETQAALLCDTVRGSNPVWVPHLPTDSARPVKTRLATQHGFYQQTTTQRLPW